MNIMLLTLSVCGVEPSEEGAYRRLWIFMKSVAKAKAPVPHVYGIGRTFPGYRQISLDWQLEYLKANRSGYTHVLFTHGWDVMLTAPWEEIVATYKAMGSPPSVYSTHFGLGNVSSPDEDYPNVFDKSIFYRYPQVGQHFSEMDYIIDIFDKMLDGRIRQTGDDCFSLYDAYAAGWFRPMLDTKCELFHVSPDYADVVDGRLVNTVTGSRPCLMHLPGGYTSPDYGKDPTMIPWARRLGIIDATEERP